MVQRVNFNPSDPSHTVTPAMEGASISWALLISPLRIAPAKGWLLHCASMCMRVVDRSKGLKVTLPTYTFQHVSMHVLARILLTSETREVGNWTCVMLRLSSNETNVLCRKEKHCLYII